MKFPKLWKKQSQKVIESNQLVLDELRKVADKIQESAVRSNEGSFQHRVKDWMLACFGYQILKDRKERMWRFSEESIELMQAGGVTLEEVKVMADAVYSKPSGVLGQEIGGTMVCLAALCVAHEHDMDEDARVELDRCWELMDRIRQKHQAKKLRQPLSPLPGVVDGPDPNAS